MAQLNAALRLMKKSTSAIPTLGSAVEILVECFDNMSVTTEMAQQFEELSSHLEVNLKCLAELVDDLNPADMAQSIDNAIRALTNEANRINKNNNRAGSKRYRQSSENMEELLRCYRRIDSLIQNLSSHAIISDDLMQKLDPVRQARYNSSIASQVGRTSCTANTRQSVLLELQNWVNNPHSAKIYWMNGMAGTGKTTIAYTLCELLESSHQLAASFFCSRSLSGCRDVNRLVPTVAHQLGMSCHPFKDVLCEALDRDQSLASLSLATQFERLIAQPLRTVEHKIPSGLLVVVIDALDELADRLDVSRVLDTLLQQVSGLPVKFFITCRPDSSLLNKLSRDRGAQSLYHLHDIEGSLVQADIEIYLRHQLSSMGVMDQWIKQLVEQSGNLFIYASTAVQYVGLEDESLDHQERLEVILGVGSYAVTRSHEQLNDLYTTILSTALEDKVREKREIERIKLVLYTVLCAREPLTLSDIAHLLGLRDAKQAGHAIEPLRSVIHVSEENGLVSTLHTSFHDYMLDESRSGRFSFDSIQHNQLMAQKCFFVMKSMLRFNICNLESSFVLDSEVPHLSDRLNNAISSCLYYAIQYWADHMILLPTIKDTTIALADFLSNRLLYWMEVMNLKHRTQAGVQMLLAVCDWLKDETSREILLLCQDAARFATVVAANAVRKSTPHIYVSVLALWNKKMPVWRCYGPRMRGLVNSSGPAVDARSPGALAAWRADCKVASMVASPSGQIIATGSHNGTVCIWEVFSGRALVGPFQAHADWVRCIAFSPDGNRVVTGSDDQTVSVWDATTGHIITTCKTKDQEHYVRSVAYSDRKHVASGSENGKIHIWDTITGHQALKTLEGHTGCVYSLAYSPNGLRIASASEDCSIRVWDAQAGQLSNSVFIGHSEAVNSVAYSPDGKFITSGSNDKTIRIWDVETGATLDEPLEGHNEAVTSVSYSPDGRYILSGSYDGIVRMWEVRTHQNVASSFAGAYSGYAPPVFILGGVQIGFCSDGYTFQIWDVQAKSTNPPSTEGRSDPVYSVAFSPNSRLLASGSKDSTISIWDAQTGARTVDPLIGHTEAINSVVFSPCGGLIASGSNDQTVRVWNVRTGHAAAEPFRGHSGIVLTVAFSPDGLRIASGSGDHTICIWDTHSGQLMAGPFTQHTNWVWSLRFSPDGHSIASSSKYTVRICDTMTGKVVAGPFLGGKWSVAYSPDGRRIASDFDGNSVVVRDPRNGHITTGPCVGRLVRGNVFATELTV
ncbi:hypothetical protein RhiJN_21690 [Ceratobasidium sp. AG-Ba]|nr:hypothetical protein RhiJN_21690 [Ceratobasidium sp. AG-Ba]